MSNRVTRKGQVTIPKKVRDLLAIEPGSAVDFELAPGGLVVVKKAGGGRKQSAFARVRGSATETMSTDEIMALTRGEA